MHFIYFDANPGTLKSNNSYNLEISGQKIYLEDETVVLTCVANITVEDSVCVFDNCASIDWTTAGLKTTGASIYSNTSLSDSILNVTSTLQIPNVDQSNTGVYTCGLTVGVTTVAARSLSLTVYG